MIIGNLEHLEVVTEDNKIEGGRAFADAGARSYASGRYFAATYTNTYTNVYSSYYYKRASSSSFSSASAY